jgi:peptidoglycan hydrolase CwlO-like protein
MCKKITAIMLSMMLVWFSTPAGLARGRTAAAADLDQLVEKSYLDLLELREIPVFSDDQYGAIKDRLENQKNAEQERLKKEEKTLEEDVQRLRKELDEFNKRSSRDTQKMEEKRAELHCRVLQAEAEEKKIQTERERGVPVMYQNKFAKLDLVRQWPAVRDEIEQKIEFGHPRDRRFGDVEDIRNSQSRHR